MISRESCYGNGLEQRSTLATASSTTNLPFSAASTALACILSASTSTLPAPQIVLVGVEEVYESWEATESWNTYVTEHGREILELGLAVGECRSMAGLSQKTFLGSRAIKSVGKSVVME